MCGNKRRKSIISITAILLFTALLVFTAVFGLGKTGTGAAKNIRLGLDLSGGVSVTYQAVGDKAPTAEEMSDTVYKLQQRVTNYSTEASVYQEGNNRINIEIPGVTDADKILEELGKPGSLEFTLDDGTKVLTGADIASAEASVQKDDMGNNEYIVSLSFSKDGTKAFGDATSAHVGENLSIVYDGDVISSPVIKEAITDGKCVISGNFTMDSASELASYIRIGSLSVELEEIRSNVVGAQLGEKALHTSLIAGFIGLVLIIIFMIVVYRVPGIIAGLSLILYTALDMVMINAFDMTLTLAGIAGVILSIGMAVDANVIIYARIKEDISSGSSIKSAIDSGYKKAIIAIIDGNVTTLIAALVLNFMATGTVKGFAQTLGLGIVLSMFTACFVSKILLNSMYALGVNDVKYFGLAKKIAPIGFTAKKKLFFAIGIACILVGPLSMLLYNSSGNGLLNLGMEFRGGTATNVAFKDDYSIAEIDSEIKPVISGVTGDAEIQAQKVSGTNEIIFKTRTLTLDEREVLSDALSEKFDIAENDGVKSISYETISSIISHEMRQHALIAVIIAIILMLIYIWIRFSNVRFAFSAVLALCHDVLVVLACYAVVRIPIGNTFIACMLTIVGYSINATIVIFDRIRENLKKRKSGDSLDLIVDTSVTQTLTRSIYTSLTTFIMVAILYILGVPSIKEFALPLMVGIVAGGFSSVCITGSLWRTMYGKEGDKK